jgi:outer membrane protein OmpA-like peptidoglycan-associated protein
MVPRTRAALAAVVLVTGARAAAADPFQLGGFFGPRVFSKDAQLGNIEGVNDTLTPGVALGFRFARPLFSWLVPEVELPFATTSTRQYNTDVFWLEPRAQLRVVFLPHQKIQPFVLAGTGMPVTLSSKRGIFGSGVTGEGYAGGGVLLAPGRGVSLRLDARVGIQPGVGAAVEPELEITIGVSFAVGATDAEKARRKLPPPPPPDTDHDGLLDAVDKCPDRAEDKDGFEDDDGCPDIDNDGDEVLDIADNCPLVPETFNGFEDDDGCPDTVPDDVDAIRGTVEGLLYNPGELPPRASAGAALDRIAATMTKHPSIKVLAIGYADDREAAPAGASPPPDLDALSLELSRQRAEAVKAELVQRGITPGRVDVIAKGAEDPVDDNATPRGRLHNRRVEVKFFVPKR